MGVMGSRTRLAAAAVAAALAAGCESSTGAGTGHLTVLLTDSPIAGIQSASFHISQVYLIGGSDATGPRYAITGTPVDYDLLTLQDGVTAQLGDADIPVGTYTQMRFVVAQATITLKDPLTFSDGSTSKTLTVPSGMQTGIKVNFGGPLQITPGRTVLVAEIDVSRNFVFTGPPSAPTGALFTPVIRAAVQNLAGSISGTVGAGHLPALVFAINPNLTAPADTVTTAVPDGTTGAYALPLLPPGTYTVLAVSTANPAPYAVIGTQTGVVVAASQDTPSIDFP
jgi:hypothetical protein